MSNKITRYGHKSDSQIIDSLRAENAALRAEVTEQRVDHMKLVEENHELRQQLAISQLEAKRLRDTMQQIAGDPEETPPFYWWQLYARDALSSPTSTDALDAYVADKLKEKVEEHRRATLFRYEQTVEIIRQRDEYKQSSDFNFEQYQDLSIELDKVCRQRDLAIDALEYHQRQTRPIENTMNVLKAIKSQNQTTDKSVDKSLADSDGV